jgi:hypothetical protein
MCLAPLTYVLWYNAVPTAEDLARDFSDIDDTLEATLSHTCPEIRKDSTRVYDILKPLIIEGACVGVSSCQSIDVEMVALYFNTQGTSGPANHECHKTLAYQTLMTKFTGFSRKFTFDDYIAVY